MTSFLTPLLQWHVSVDFFSSCRNQLRSPFPDSRCYYRGDDTKQLEEESGLGLDKSSS